MESWKLRRRIFTVFFLLIPISYALHYPVISGKMAGIISRIGMLLTVASIITAFYLHSLFPKTHKKPSDFNNLLTEGPYRYVRHPFYSAFIFMGFGIALWCLSIPGLVGYTLLLPFWVRLAKREEEELLDYWGDAYREFMETRGRFLPVLRRVR